MNSISPFMKLMATRLKPIGPDKAMEFAIDTGIILARELQPEEQTIVGNVFLVIGQLLTKSSSIQNYEWQQRREAQIEILEIETEIQKLQKRLNKLTETNNLKD
ncbi:MAG TPA: hypothetical protein PKA10_12385 [Selenomonadales bacterium]|nr:hypothetical protein [Selenomonadales bacterium]